MTFKSLISLFAIFLSCLLSSAQDTKEKVTQKWATEKVEFHKITGDSLEFILEDYQRNMELDSAWRSQLINQSYSRRMEMIIKDSLESSEVIKELPTELLKERLATLNAKTPFNIEYNKSLESVISYFLKTRKRRYRTTDGIEQVLLSYV